MIVDKVKDHEGLVKDRQSGAILMASHSQAAEYLNKKKQIQQQHEIRNEINTIKESTIIHLNSGEESPTS